MTPSSDTISHSPSQHVRAPIQVPPLLISTDTNQISDNQDAAVLLIASQVSNILKFFLYKNIRIARDRAWDQTVASRGKGPDFWGPYVEEWTVPPAIGVGGWTWEKWVGGWFGRMVIMRGELYTAGMLQKIYGVDADGMRYGQVSCCP